MSHGEAASQRCPQCHRSFRVLADEVGMHACPRCGYVPEWPDERDLETREDEEGDYDAQD